MTKITIIDYGVGNLGSIQNMLKYINVDFDMAFDHRDIKAADKVLLPGVGAFDAAIDTLHEKNLVDSLNEFVTIKKKPLLGICLGMQLLTNQSEEGKKKGFGWIEGEATKFNFGDNPDKLKVPHMGWNFIQPQYDNPLLAEMDETYRFYFVHSYFVSCQKKDNVLATTHFGHDFASIINKDNVFGAQFHPEKSHKFGMKLLNNFAKKV